MVLKKEDMIPGTKVRIVSLKSKTAGIIFASPNLPDLAAIRAWDVERYIGVDIAFGAVPGEILTIVKKPRRIKGICNCCRVKNEDGLEGEVYWTELRSNAELV
jgi:hypothetical protein